ncbi:hypothetical protein DCS_02165 [Drechmeria coniospora]|uniref:Uncharacterized protein n=1 Tax=Drechmeria coniospora TaxID=98403 RepID=A0A151GV86_DRECN|nr:hypothetical protein DCS_02165 [Drechmeria coniospora]KYK61025.1 hypothetical protein DCS_02165 [Drechmeria coniospora]
MPCSKSWRMREPNAGGASHRHGHFARPTATAYTDGGTGKHARQDWRRRRLAGLDNGSRSNSRPSPPPPARYGLKKSSQVKGDAGLIERFTVCVRLGISGGRVAAQTFATLRTMASVFEETKAIAGSQLVEIMDTSERVA